MVTLTTERLVLTPPSRQDWEDWARHQADPVCMHETAPQDEYTAWGNLLAAAGSWSINGFGVFSIRLRDSGAWIGKCGPARPWGWPGIELGWSLLPAYHGKGYAREAAQAALDWVLTVPGVTGVVHTIRPDNLASQRIAIALGSRNTGPLDPLPTGITEPNDLWVNER